MKELKLTSKDGKHAFTVVVDDLGRCYIDRAGHRCYAGDSADGCYPSSSYQRDGYYNNRSYWDYVTQVEKKLVFRDVADPYSGAIVPLTPERIAWFEANWPLHVTDRERWEELKPAGVTEYQQWRTECANAAEKRQKQYEDESNVEPLASAGSAPELSAEARAWITISDMMEAANDRKYSAGKHGMQQALAGTPLPDAAALAEKEWSDYLAKAMWD